MNSLYALSCLGNLRVTLTDTPNSPRYRTKISEMDEMLAATADLIEKNDRVCDSFQSAVRCIAQDIRRHKVDGAYAGVIRLYAAMEVIDNPARYDRSWLFPAA